MDDFTITLTNKRIFEFYKKNETISFETMNLLFLDFIEKLNSDLTQTINTSTNLEVLGIVKDLSSQVFQLNANVSSISSSISLKFHETNKDYLENIKLLFESSSSYNSDKMSTIMDKNNEIFFNKIAEAIPKNNESLLNKLETNLKEVKQSIFQELTKQENNPEAIKEYLTSLDSRLQTLQTPILSFIGANQEQVLSNLNAIKEKGLIENEKQERVLNVLEEFLNKYKSNVTCKGQYSENMLQSILNKMFPSMEIVNTTGSKASGDFIMKRDSIPFILFENKNYESNVNLEEIKKFLRDVNEQRCNGILMSQSSGIVCKPDFFIEIHDGSVLVYLHNVEYSQEKIKVAVNIIEHLSSKLSEMNVKDGNNIDKDVLDNINKEYQTFLNQRAFIVETCKTFHKNVIAQIENLKMPDLGMYLNSKYASIQNQEFVCDECGACFSKKASLASHKKSHKK